MSQRRLRHSAYCALRFCDAVPQTSENNCPQYMSIYISPMPPDIYDDDPCQPWS
jgi:hypothetical protein